MCDASWRKPVHQITDRAKRYRANEPECRLALPAECAICGSTRFRVIDHIDGNESNGSPENLRWLCKSCNTRLGVVMARTGQGRRTRQFNPCAANIAQYVQAAFEHRRDAHDEGGRIIHGTPKEIRDALRRFDDDVDECEMRVEAQEAIQPLCQAVEKRQLDERLIEWAVRELPWSSTERDEARLRRECAEILEEVPLDASEEEAKEELEPTIRQACRQIKEHQARKQREEQKASLIREGVAEVSHYLWRLKQDGEISSEEYWDADLRADLQETVREELESELSGEETTKEVQSMAREIIDEGFE